MSFLPEEEGVTSIEYALLGSLIALVALIGISTLGDAVLELYDKLAEEVTDALDG